MKDRIRVIWRWLMAKQGQSDPTDGQAYDDSVSPGMMAIIRDQIDAHREALAILDAHDRDSTAPDSRLHGKPAPYSR
jgi:hypothetical protein